MDNTCKTPNCVGQIYVKSHGLCAKCYNKARYHGKIEVKGQSTMPTTLRLWANIAIKNPSECWEWIGQSKTAGYGTIYDSVSRKRLLAHRVAWIDSYGPIPDGEGAHGTVVLHKCDNRLCCNPAHLMLGTQADNVRDMDRKGRRVSSVRYGEKHHATKITADHVREIRESNDSKLDQHFADKFGMARSSVKQVRLRRTWKHIK